MEKFNLFKNTSYESLILLLLLNEGLLLNTETPTKGVFSKIHEILTRSSIFNIKSDIAPLFYGLYDFVACPVTINDINSNRLINKSLSDDNCATLLIQITYSMKENTIPKDDIIKILPATLVDLDYTIAQIILNILQEYTIYFLNMSKSNITISENTSDYYKNLIINYFELCDLYSKWSSLQKNKSTLIQNGNKAGNKVKKTVMFDKSIQRHLRMIRGIHLIFFDYMHSQRNYFTKDLQPGELGKKLDTGEWFKFIDPLISESENELIRKLVELVWLEDFSISKDPRKINSPSEYNKNSFPDYLDRLIEGRKLKSSKHSPYNLIKNYLLSAIKLIKNDFFCMNSLEDFTEKVAILSSANKKEKSVLYKHGYIHVKEDTFIRKQFDNVESYELQITLGNEVISIKTLLFAPEFIAMNTNMSSALHHA